MTFFGFMHGESVGIAVTPTVAASYAVVAVFLYLCSRMEAPASETSALPAGDPVPAE
jgi:AGZA family xanthine/uracil permease-like MFS transporter